jgi:hypothetical protein
MEYRLFTIVLASCSLYGYLASKVLLVISRLITSYLIDVLVTTLRCLSTGSDMVVEGKRGEG